MCQPPSTTEPTAPAAGIMLLVTLFRLSTLDAQSTDTVNHITLDQAVIIDLALVVFVLFVSHRLWGG